jgi:tetratricopeptide (TPR) repeat protein
MRYLEFYWSYLLEYPLDWIDYVIAIDTPFRSFVAKSVISLMLVYILYWIFKVEVLGRIRERRRLKQNFDPSILEVDARGPGEESASIALPQDFKTAFALLKRGKDFLGLAKLCMAHGKPRVAAKWYWKAGHPREAADALIQGGRTLKAARWLERGNHPAEAARLYLEKRRPAAAARAFRAAHDLSAAAEAYLQAKKYAQAAIAFQEFLELGGEDQEKKAAAAEHCYRMLGNEKTLSKIPEAQRAPLFELIAKHLEGAQRNDLAADVYTRLGQHEKAGKVYLKIGELDKAMRSLQKAGKSADADSVMGNILEKKQQWKQAAEAFTRAGMHQRAGDCYAKINDALNAAVCYETSGDFFMAGFGLIHAKHWEKALLLLQKVPEGNPRFNESRSLLGRCFFEMQDYAQCVAVLENHLTGARVGTANIDYFWMLALAYEQVGKLETSQEVLQKIRSVNIHFRDIEQRLSNINSRISMAPERGSTMTPDSLMQAPTQEQTQVMTMVENSVGTRYKLERELGRGGMGVIYLAQDTNLDRKVALKFLGSAVDGNPEFKKRFTREAKAAAKVSHPNIVAIYDIGTQEGKAYIAMEFIEGGDLSKYLRKNGKLAPREAANILGQACAAMEAVHQAGVVHRDIKPENIVLTSGGLVKVMDFGLAMAQDMRITTGNMIMGTPLYMSPEQAQGQEVDARTDIYALGMVLYELLTGAPPILGQDILERQISEMPPPPSSKNPAITPELDAIIMKCIAKNREERYPTAQELQEALRGAEK